MFRETATVAGVDAVARVILPGRDCNCPATLAVCDAPYCPRRIIAPGWANDERLPEAAA